MSQAVNLPKPSCLLPALHASNDFRLPTTAKAAATIMGLEGVAKTADRLPIPTVQGVEEQGIELLAGKHGRVLHERDLTALRPGEDPVGMQLIESAD